MAALEPEVAEPFGSAPPWILGHRGAPRQTPENTLLSLRRALELGLDGFEYDLRACATGEPVLLHDETLDRTTDATGPLRERSLPELAGIDAGGWFDKRFAGEPLALLDEALDLSGETPGTWPMHMIELKEREEVDEVVRRIRERSEPLTIRLASFDRDTVLRVRDLGLSAMLLAVEADEADRRFVRDEGIAAYGTGPGGWRVPAADGEWPCERWSWAVDDPADLLEACRRPLFGFNTNEPERALAVRALVQRTPQDRGPYPLGVPRLEVRRDVPSRLEPGASAGAWSGSWSVPARIRNPFPFDVDVLVDLAIRGGAFRYEGLPVGRHLAPGAEVEVPFELVGGSFSPGDDPLLFARFSWEAGPGRPAGDLLLDAPLERVRSARLRSTSVRLEMLCERHGQRPATMTLRRSGDEVLARVEDSGGLTHVEALLRLGARVRRGGIGVRLSLSALDRLELEEGRPFCVGFRGRDPGRASGAPVLRRFCGGLPMGLFAGAPGRLWGADEG